MVCVCVCFFFFFVLRRKMEILIKTFGNPCFQTTPDFYRVKPSPFHCPVLTLRYHQSRHSFAGQDRVNSSRIDKSRLVHWVFLWCHVAADMAALRSSCLTFCIMLAMIRLALFQFPSERSIYFTRPCGVIGSRVCCSIK